MTGRVVYTLSGKQSMLWYDGDKQRALADKVRRGADYFRQKYGVEARRCFVHPMLFSGAPGVVDGIKILPSKTVLPNHFSFQADGKKE